MFFLLLVGADEGKEEHFFYGTFFVGVGLGVGGVEVGEGGKGGGGPIENDG